MWQLYPGPGSALARLDLAANSGAAGDVHHLTPVIFLRSPFVAWA